MIRQMGGLPEIVAGLKAGRSRAARSVSRRCFSPRRRVSRFGRLQHARLPISAVVSDRDGKSCCGLESLAVRGFSKPISTAVHRFKTDPNFAMSVIGKYTSTADRSMLEETQRVYASSFERIPYPNVEDMKLGIAQVAETNPRAKGADPKDFVNRPAASRDRKQADSSSGFTASRGNELSLTFQGPHINATWGSVDR